MMKKTILLTIIALMLCSCGGEKGSNTNNSTQSSATNVAEKKSISSNEAVELAQSSYLFEDELLESVEDILKYGIRYDIATYEVKSLQSNEWEVSFNCKVTGYTDKFKEDFRTTTRTVRLKVNKESGAVSRR